MSVKQKFALCRVIKSPYYNKLLVRDNRFEAYYKTVLG